MANRLGIKGRTVDLYVRLVDAAGNPVDADETPEVAVYDSNSDLIRASSDLGVSSVSGNTGLYYLSYEIPITGVDGYWADVWSCEIGGEATSATLAFKVMSSGSIAEDEEPVYTPGDDVPWDFTQEEVYGINVLLKSLRYRLKSSGTRKERVGNQYVSSECNVFSDNELIVFLVNSLSSFNQYPHFTNFTFADAQIYSMFSDIILQGAGLLALAAQALIEKGREFNLTDNGITYQPPAVADLINNQYSTQLTNYMEKLKAIKCSLKPGPLGLGTYRVTAISPNYLRLRHLRERQLI